MLHRALPAVYNIFNICDVILGVDGTDPQSVNTGIRINLSSTQEKMHYICGSHGGVYVDILVGCNAEWN
jgi:hypothetical protein